MVQALAQRARMIFIRSPRGGFVLSILIGGLAEAGGRDRVHGRGAYRSVSRPGGFALSTLESILLGDWASKLRVCSGCAAETAPRDGRPGHGEHQGSDLLLMAPQAA